MEVVPSAPETFSSSARKKNLLPLSQLVEDTRKPANVPHHLLETRVFTKLKSNSVVQAEPSELHFSGFEVGKDYRKTLKLVNISCEVVSVHILPPLTQNFQIKYTKKCRLVPGLAYTVTVNFRPDEWHYFFDNIRIHCKGEENLLVPVHAYPVINDLHIPARITLPPVPLGQSTSHVIPLKCSCPIDFEFHVHCLQPHEAFTIKPLAGIIPANGKTEIKVTFTPVRYCTADITLQLLISQFNSKPVVWTVTGSSSPYLLTSKKDGNGDVLVKEQSYHGPRKALALSKGVEKKRKDDLQVSNTDIPTRAIQPQDKMRYKDLRDNVSNTKPEEQTKKMVKQKQERASHNRWPANVGDNKLHIRKAQDCKLNYGGKSVAISKSSPKRSSRQVLRNAKRLEVRSKALRLFKQAVLKVIHQCRKNKRLQGDKNSTGQLLKLTPEKLLPFSFPTFLHEDQPDELAVNSLGHVPVRPPIPDMKLSIPIFSPKVPQHYRLMGYQPVSVYDAAATFIPSGLCRTLRAGEEDEFLACSSTDLSEDEEDWNTEEHEGPNQDLYPNPSSCGPEALLNPPNAHPLQILNNAPHGYAVKPASLYVKCDLDSHPCPRRTQKRRVMGLYTPPTQKTFQDRKDIKKGIMTQEKFPSMALKTISSMSTGDQTLHMSDTFSKTLIPMKALPTLQNLPECIKDNIQLGLFNGSELSLTPEMVETEFGVSERSSVTSLKQEEDEGERESHEQPLESNHSNRSSAEASAIEMLGRTSISTSPCDNK